MTIFGENQGGRYFTPSHLLTCYPQGRLQVGQTPLSDRLLDLCYVEDVRAEMDMNIVMNGQGRFIEVQGRPKVARSIARCSIGCST